MLQTPRLRLLSLKGGENLERDFGSPRLYQEGWTSDAGRSRAEHAIGFARAGSDHMLPRQLVSKLWWRLAAEVSLQQLPR